MADPLRPVCNNAGLPFTRLSCTRGASGSLQGLQTRNNTKPEGCQLPKTRRGIPRPIVRRGTSSHTNNTAPRPIAAVRTKHCKEETTPSTIATNAAEPTLEDDWIRRTPPAELILPPPEQFADTNNQMFPKPAPRASTPKITPPRSHTAARPMRPTLSHAAATAAKPSLSHTAVDAMRLSLSHPAGPATRTSCLNEPIILTVASQSVPGEYPAKTTAKAGSHVELTSPSPPPPRPHTAARVMSSSLSHPAAPATKLSLPHPSAPAMSSPLSRPAEPAKRTPCPNRSTLITASHAVLEEYSAKLAAKAAPQQYLNLPTAPAATATVREARRRRRRRRKRAPRPPRPAPLEAKQPTMNRPPTPNPLDFGIVRVVLEALTSGLAELLRTKNTMPECKQMPLGPEPINWRTRAGERPAQRLVPGK